MAITAIHTLVYSDDAAATRAFFKDVLQWPFVVEGTNSSGAPQEWLIFATGRSELGVHPTTSEHGGETYTSPRQHQISVMCDDLDVTVAELGARGALFTGEPRDMGFGRGVMLQVPGADDILLYQPHHATAFDL